MVAPALQNRTVRRLILYIASFGAVSAIVGFGVLSFRQTRATATRALEEKTEVWADAVGMMVNTMRTRLRQVSETTGGAPAQPTVEALRQLVAESPLCSAVVVIRNGKIVCTNFGIPGVPEPATDAMLELGPPRSLLLAKIDAVDGKPGGIAMNYESGLGFSLTAFVPSPGVAELMRFGDRKADHAVFFLTENGETLDRSVNVALDASLPSGKPAEGLVETSNGLVFTRRVEGLPYFVSAVLPKSSLLALWSENLPLYGGLALAIAASFLIAGWMASARTQSLEYELREAARLRQIVAHYQPIIDLRTGACVGVEVLMRWQHPTRGLVPPLAFIPEAERTGVITDLTECLMVTALHELAPLFEKYQGLCAAINVPVQTLTNPAFPAHVARLLRKKLSYSQICFELTESTSLNDSALAQLHEMKALGVRLAVDDFGTGYSNLRYLSIFPFDSLKIDKAFVDGISPDGRSTGLVDQIVSIGKACKLELIAEGIERVEQADYLRRLEVEYGQGYHFAKPMSVDALTQWLDEKNTPVV